MVNNIAAPKPPIISYRKILIAGLATFLLLFGGLFGWMAYAGISGAVVATGSVVVRGKPKQVQHLDGGIVKELNVENGDLVEQGDVLVRLDETLLLANFEIYRNRLREALVRKARLEAERDGASEITFDRTVLDDLNLGEDEGQKIGQTSLFEARRNTRLGQIKQQEEKILQFGNQLAGVNALVASKKTQLELIREELEGMLSLRKKGLMANTRVLAQERAVADMTGQLAGHESDLARINNSIQETKISILQVERSFQEQVITELREVSSATDDLIQQIIATKKQLERVDIRAPVSGIVHELNLFTLGGVVAPGSVIMQIISVEQGVEVEVNVDPQSIDQLHPDQTATIRFPAFNQRTTPEIFGSIGRISPSSVIDQQTGFAFYRVSIIINADQLDRLGDLTLVPGMPAEVFVQTEERTVLGYLMKPLSDQFVRVFREE